MMSAFWESLALYQQIALCIAVPTTIVLVVQFALLLFGLSDSGLGGVAVDTDGDGLPDTVDNLDDGPDWEEVGGLKLFTLRGILTFFAIGSWTTLVVSLQQSPLLSITVGLISGAVADIIYAFVMRAVQRLQENGAVQLKNAVGTVGEVYIPIPPKKRGNGKISLVLHGKLCEVEAIWDGDDFLPTGSKVFVSGLLGDSLIVERLTDHA